MNQSTDILAKFDTFLKEADRDAPVEVPFEVRDNITHKLTFHKGRAKNFRSIGNEFMEIDYQRNPATLVTSDDNGAGKSTMLVWLLFFVLYNDTYSKKEKKAGLVNSQSRKECVGEVEFSCRGSEWKVRRGIKPDFVEVYQMVDNEWKQVTNEAAKADMNKFIVNLIGVDQKMFENSLVLGKEKFIPFSEMYTADRRAMVETIWDLGFFSVMNEEVKASIKAIDKELETISNSFGAKIIEHTNKKTNLAQVVHSNSLIQQQSADILVQERERLAVVDADITLCSEDLMRLTESEMSATKQIVDLEEKLNAESMKEIEVVRAEYAVKIQAVNDDAEGKAEDYERIEVSAAISERNALVAQKEQRLVIKNDILLERSQNQNELSKALQRHQQGQAFRMRFASEMDAQKESIKRFHDMGECPTCTQHVSDETKAQVEQKGMAVISDIQAKINKADEAIAEIVAQMSDFEAKDAVLVERLNVVNGEIEAINLQIATANGAIESLRRDVQGFYDIAKVQVSSLKRELETKILDLRKALNTRFEDITASLQGMREQASNGKKAVANKMGELNDRRVALLASIAELERKVTIQPMPTAPLEAEIAVIEEELSALEARRQQKDEELQDHQALLFFLKDDQTKARIISLYLPFLNSKINEYLEGMNMFLDIVVDDTFEITMSAAGRKGQSIFSLSTGQRSRLNLAITLALRDVANLKASVQCNLFVLDEILENMSERGVQEAVEMLKYKFSGNNLFVISQREQEFQEYFPHNIRYGLRNGLTEVIRKD